MVWFLGDPRHSLRGHFYDLLHFLPGLRAIQSMRMSTDVSGGSRADGSHGWGSASIDGFGGREHSEAF